ncbi:MAG: TatD family hydrolase [Prevotella sp.]|nr:TatD family hydrolase [Prevotella sp.]
MIIDTHCHIDMLPSPESYLLEKEQSEDITIGMTNLPSHFAMGIPYFNKLKKSRLALGFHPQLAQTHQSELKVFPNFISKTSYIGEVGLDFSKNNVDSKDIQLSSFDFICQCIRGTNKIVSVHSRKAEKEVLDILKKYAIKNVIFHWYSGPLGLMDEIISSGYYFSINESMTLSLTGKKIIGKIPQNRILTETDEPFNKYSNIPNTIANMGLNEKIIHSNFMTLIKSINVIE